MTETAENHIQSFYTESAATASSLDDIEMISTNTEGLEQEVYEQADGIAILVQMAKSGKIDPWNVDIVDITDKYLAHLFQLKSQNLRLTGRTLLFAAILLRLKSNVLEGIDVSQFEDTPQDELDYTDDDWDDMMAAESEISTNNVISLDEVLQ